MRNTLFRHKPLAFEPIDPLDDGLGDMIQEEQRRDSIDLYGDDAQIGEMWRAMEQDGDRLAFED